MELTRIDGLNDYLGKFTKENRQEKNTISYYEDLFKSKELVDIKFSGFSNGTLFVEDNGVRVELPSSDFENSGFRRRASLNETYKAVVTNVDKENNVVTLSASKVKDTAKQRYEEEIKKMLEKNEIFYVKARVEYVNEKLNRAVVNIAGVGIIGFIPIGEWSHTYITKISNYAKPGDIVVVGIKGKGKVSRKEAYLCSRKCAMEDTAWEGIEKRYPEKTMVKIKCTHRNEKSWFGAIEGLDDIEVFCEYPDGPDKKGNDIMVVPGGEYSCFIYRVNEEKRLLKARVLYRIS